MIVPRNPADRERMHSGLSRDSARMGGYGRGQYGFLPVIAAILPMVTGMFQQGQADNTPPPPPPMNPLLIAGGVLLGAIVLGGTAYMVLKK